MSEQGEIFKAWKEHKQKKKCDNTKQNLGMLDRNRIPYMILNHDIPHLLVCGQIDFWPSTGKFIVRGIGGKSREGRGIFNLIKTISKLDLLGQAK